MGEIPSADWSWLHSTAEQFEQAWKMKPRPRIEDYLATVDESRRPSLLEELLRVECELRHRDGDPSPAEDYLGRFPQYGDVVASVLDRGQVGATLSAEAGQSASLRETSHSDRGTAEPVPPDLASHPDYHVVRELGRGGMGVVYLAHNRLMARDEVLKVMGRHIVEQPGVLDRFLREIRAVARLRHPNIVSAYSAFRCGEDLVFAMEYVVGLNLAQMVKAKGAVAVRQACAYVHQAALGLHYAHEEGMVHRDIKPANLMLSYQRERAIIKLLDFGLSKAASEQSASDLGIGMAIDSYELGEHLTCTGEMLGTPDFIAPEQITDSQQADIRADIYSLGCTLYYLLSGQAPFPNLTLREVLKAHRSRHAGPLDQVRAGVPANLSAIVARMMAKDPADRFQEPAQVAEALTAFFKKGSLAGGPSRADSAIAMQSEATPVTLGAATMPSSPATELATGVMAEAESSSRVETASTFGGLINLAETDSGSEKRLEIPFWRRPGRWGWSAIAGVLVLGLMTAWAAVPRTTRENVPTPAIGSRKQVSESDLSGPKASKIAPPLAAPKDLIVSSPLPIARWTFESDTRDQIGKLHGTLFGGAAIQRGRLYLDGKSGYMKTEPLSRDIREKTLEAWVVLTNLSQRGGGVISIEDSQYRYYDAIVFGEREPAKWMPGSDMHRRSKNLDAPVENAQPSALIHLAVVYDREGGITVYREGKPYAARYIPEADRRTVPSYHAGESHVLIGERHTQPPDFLAGAVEEARLYDRALTPDEVAASYRAGVVRSTSDPGPLSAPPQPPDVPHPFRLATHGLGGREFIDPVSLRPDWAWFSEPGTALAWATNNDFARLTTKGAIAYAQLPESRYVLELELTVSTHGEVELQIGDMNHRFHQLRFAWNDQRQKIECMLHRRDYATMRGHPEKKEWLHDFAPRERISLVMVVGDGRQVVFHDKVPILSCDDWPQDCCLRILSYKRYSGVIHRCALRRLTPRDAAECRSPMPPTELGLNASESAARLRRLFGMVPKRWRKEQPFAVKTTGTPMVWIKPGEFVMGPPDPKNEARHRVRLTKGYWMAQTEVTQGEFQSVTNGNPSRVRGSSHLPVDWVAWDQAMDFCRKLTEIERIAGRLPPGYEYRLPTEAEWEYACRAGSDEEFSVPKETIWSRDRGECQPHEVAESRPNRWGLYDMHGNAMEWCLDVWYDYPRGSMDVTIDPVRIQRPDRDTSFVVRGGAWWTRDNLCASDWRDRNPNTPNGFRGFRIVLGPEIQGLKIKE